MATTLKGKHFARRAGTVFHPVVAGDKTAMAAIRAIVEPNKGRLQGTAARVPFDAIMEHVAVPEGVTFEADTVGGIPGWWCRPQRAQPGAAAFAPDYRLAPEHPFPAAAEDVRAGYLGLIGLVYKRVAVTGDSAGGNLALGLLISLKESHPSNPLVPFAGVALSPVTDLSLSGASWMTRAAADPYFTHPQVAELVRSYLNGADPGDSSASPLRADLAGLPPIRVHVGEDEVLLDDSVRFIDRALTAGVEAQLDVWEGMVHGFPGSVGQLSASNQALQQIGSFLSQRFTNVVAERQTESQN